MRPKPPVKPPTPYRSFLTPALHRRFVRACLWSFCASGIFAICIDGSVPLGILPLIKTFVSSLLVFTCCLPIFGIRLSDVRVGSSTTASTFESFRTVALTLTPYTAGILYIASALLFGEISIWSASTDAKLYIVEKGGPNARAHLNERPLYYRSLFFILALIQVTYHFALDLDQIIFPLHKNAIPENATPPFLNFKAISTLGGQSLAKSVLAAVLGTFGYRFVYRATLWEWAFNSLDYLYSFPKHSYNRRNYHFDISGLFFKFVLAGFMLSFLWDFTNTVFSYYIIEAPLKKGNPITDDSKDPNGSLINGLKEKRLHRKSMAFWELVLISKKFDIRRKTIFQDIERSNSSSWSQILATCLEELTGIELRIKAFSEIPTPPKPTDATSLQIPEISVDIRPTKDNNLYAVAKRDPSWTANTEAAVGSFAKSVGQQPDAPIPPVRLIQYGVKKVLSEDQVANLQSDPMRKANGFVADLLKMKIAAPFRETFDRRATAVVCGSPTSRASIIIDAIESMSNLAVHSISEDQPGQVQKDLAKLVKAMITSILAIQKFVGSTLTPHWTDVGFTAAERKNVREVNAILTSLKTGVREILDAFEEYLDDIGISRSEARAWRKLTEAEKIVRPVTPVR